MHKIVKGEQWLSCADVNEKHAQIFQIIGLETGRWTVLVWGNGR